MLSRNAALAALLWVAPLVAQTEPSPQSIARDVRPAVVTVRAMVGDEAMAFGSGFFVRSDGVLVTNLHVVRGAEWLQVELESGELFDNVYELGRDDRRDLIVLQVPATETPAVTIGDDRDVEVGEPVFVMGSPLGLDYTFSDGLLSAKRVVDGVSYLQISAPISEGSSGGPVLDQEGRAIGVATWTMSEGQNLNAAVPARHAQGLLAVAGTPSRFEGAPAEIVSEERLSEDMAAYADALDLDREARAGLASMEIWQQEVALTMLDLIGIGREEGWYALEDRDFGYLAEGEIDGVHVLLKPGRYRAVAVCDGDCTDIDLAAVGPGEKLLDRDVLDDAIPIVNFKIDRTQEVLLGVSMVRCSTPTCYYGVQVFRR